MISLKMLNQYVGETSKDLSAITLIFSEGLLPGNIFNGVINLHCFSMKTLRVICVTQNLLFAISTS